MSAYHFHHIIIKSKNHKGNHHKSGIICTYILDLGNFSSFPIISCPLEWKLIDYKSLLDSEIFLYIEEYLEALKLEKLSYPILLHHLLSGDPCFLIYKITIKLCLCHHFLKIILKIHVIHKYSISLSNTINKRSLFQIIVELTFSVTFIWLYAYMNYRDYKLPKI